MTKRSIDLEAASAIGGIVKAGTKKYSIKKAAAKKAAAKSKGRSSNKGKPNSKEEKNEAPKKNPSKAKGTEPRKPREHTEATKKAVADYDKRKQGKIDSGVPSSNKGSIDLSAEPTFTPKAKASPAKPKASQPSLPGMSKAKLSGK